MANLLFDGKNFSVPNNKDIYEEFVPLIRFTFSWNIPSADNNLVYTLASLLNHEGMWCEPLFKDEISHIRATVSIGTIQEWPTKNMKRYWYEHTSAQIQENLQRVMHELVPWAIEAPDCVYPSLGMVHEAPKNDFEKWLAILFDGELHVKSFAAWKLYLLEHHDALGSLVYSKIMEGKTLESGG